MGLRTGTAVATDDAVLASKMNAKLEAVTHVARAFAKLDLSGAAQADVVILHSTVACTLKKLIALYTEASSADAGVVITVGKESDSAYFYTGSSETGKSAWYEADLTLLQTTLDAGDTIICGNAGSKVGTGEILFFVEYEENATP